MATRDPAEPLTRANVKKVSVDSSHPDKRNIAAIDFGTTSLSLAYKTLGDHVDKEPATLSFDVDAYNPRVPNAILLEKEEDGAKHKILAVGTAARKKFQGYRSKERMKYIYFERVKMMLMRNKEITRETHVTSFSGEIFYLVQVIAFILKHMAYELENHLSTTVIAHKKEDFDWVITVPAIWNVQGKRMMREAAYLSGILTSDEGITQLSQITCGVPRPVEINQEKLSLALEPEAAAIYCQRTSKDEAKQVGSSMSKGYMVVDAGGGTVDITAQVEVKGGVKVVSIPTGNAWGGTQVNEAFSKKFQEIVGDESFARFLNNPNPANHKAVDIISRQVSKDKFLYEEFEEQKILFGKEQSNEMCITIPRDLVTFYGPQAIAEGTERIEGYDLENDNIYITKTAAEELFSEALTAIIDCTLDVLSSKNCQVPSSQIETIYLAGGFGSSKLVRKHVERALKSQFSHIKILFPISPLLAIAAGAVMWRSQPNLIQARPSDATYGIAVQLVFNDRKHNQVHNAELKKNFCRDVFEVYLLKGDETKHNERYVSDLSVPSDDAKEVTLKIYSTQEEGIQYVNSPKGEPLAQEIGQLTVNVSDSGKLRRDKRRIEMTMNFSGTEIQAKAKYSAM